MFWSEDFNDTGDYLEEDVEKVKVIINFMLVTTDIVIKD